jgi:hypothetical protein
MSTRLMSVSAALAAFIIAAPAAAAPLVSGPQVGERTLPFTSNMVTGAHRGKQFCYVCELKDEPAVLVFVRSPEAATARLLRELREAVQTYKQQKLFGWMVFLAGEETASETAIERRAWDLARENGATTLPISALGDPQGPPGYRIAPDAEATVIVFRGGKVLYNRAYRANQWTDRAAGSALKELPKLIKAAGSDKG